MANFYTGPDKWIYPVYLRAGSGLWAIRYQSDELVDDIYLRLPAGWYYNAKAADSYGGVVTSGEDAEITVSSSVEYPGFLTLIEETLNQVIDAKGGANQFSFVIATPTVAGLANSAVQLERTAGASDWTLSVTADTGDDREQSLAQSMLGIVDDIGDVSQARVWHSDVVAHDKRTVRRAESFAAGDGRAHHYMNRWAGSESRRMRYFDVPARSVRGFPNPYFGAGLETGDPNNRFVDLWLGGAESGQDIILVHHTGFDDAASLDYSDHDYDIVRFVDQTSFSAERSVISDIQGGERYTIQFEALLVDKQWAH